MRISTDGLVAAACVLATLASLPGICRAQSAGKRPTSEVEVVNFPAVQPVQGTVSVANLPEIQDVNVVAGGACMEQSLAPGGRTIGGPGVGELAEEDAAPIFADPDGDTVVSCLTLRNMGQGTALISVGSSQPNSARQAPVDPGHTQTLCRAFQVAVVECDCLANFACTRGPCRFSWRIDRP
jgi:hypothetical protein